MITCVFSIANSGPDIICGKIAKFALSQIILDSELNSVAFHGTWNLCYEHSKNWFYLANEPGSNGYSITPLEPKLAVFF